ncbi:hypothetical protein V6Z12_A03G066900 [Gossypium hirsutum]
MLSTEFLRPATITFHGFCNKKRTVSSPILSLPP